MGLEIVLKRAALRVGATGGGEVVDGFGIDGEEAHCGAVFGSHIRNRRTVGERQSGGAFAVELHEFTHDLCGAEELGHMEGEVGRSDAFAEAASEVHAHHFRSQEIHRLAEHSCLGFNAAHAPADDAEAVDHGRVGIGSNERVGVVEIAGAEDALGEILQIHLVHDADAGRHDAKSLEGLLAPFEELVALPVALEFHVEVELERIGGAVEINLHRVVHDEIDRHKGLDDGRVATEAFHSGAHGGEVHQEWHASEVLKHDTGDNERNLLFGGSLRIPVCQRLDITRLDFFPVAIAEHGFKNDADADGEFRDRADPCFFQSG